MVTGNNADSARPFVHWWRGAHSSSIEPVGMSVTIEKPAGVIPPPWQAKLAGGNAQRLRAQFQSP